MELPSNGQWAVGLIQQELHELKRQHAAVLDDRDPEPLHRMRVCFRRLRSTVHQFGPALLLPPSVSDASMARIGRRLGMTRDLDVLRQLLQDQLFPQIPAVEQQQLRGVLKQLRRERKLAFEDLRLTLKSRRYLRLLADLRPWVQQPAFTPLGEQPLLTWVPEWKATVLVGLLPHGGWFVPSLHAKGAPEQLHSLRKAIKRARYGLANLQRLEGSGVDPWIASFKALQQHLGDLNDLDVLTRAIAHGLDGEPQDLLPVLWSTLTGVRTKAWQDWTLGADPLRSPGGRRALHQMLVAGPGA